MELKGKKLRMVQRYISITKGKPNPTVQDLADNGIGRGALAHHFGSHGALRQTAKEYQPDAFKYVVDDDLFSAKDMDALKKLVGRHKRFVVTTAVSGCKIDKRFHAAVKSYCKRRKALLLVLPVADPAASVGWTMDPALEDEAIVFGNLSLNSNVSVRSIKLSAKQIDPSTGLARLGSARGSFIHGSPKQRMRMVATSNMKMPHAIMSTGAITKPDYQTNRYMSERTAYLADHDHVMGAIVVEVKDARMFHFRQVQMDKDGSFIDLGVRYQPDGKFEKVKGTAFVLGDYHSGETDPSADRAWLEVIEECGVEEVVFHDLFNGLSINHHEWNQNVARAQLAITGQASLEKEVRKLNDDLAKYLAKVDRVTIVKSNHDEFLDRYIQDGRYLKDPINFRFAHEVAIAMVDGKDPLRWACEKLGLRSDRIKWLSRDQDYKIHGIEVGSHGDLGSNGSSGTLRAMEESYGPSTTAHSHSPEILREAWRVGTSSKLKLRYNRGSSSWCHTSCLHYVGGFRQMINVVYGSWRD